MAQLRGGKNLFALLENRKGRKLKTEVFEGSMRSGKTSDIFGGYILEAAQYPNYVSRHFRRDTSVAKRTLKPDLFRTLRTYFPELWRPKNWNNVEGCYTMPTNGENAGKMYLAGTNDTYVLHGLTQVDAHVNEVMEHTLAAKRQIEGRTERYKTYDFNPSYSDHWFFTDVMGQDPDKYLYVHSTFRDNKYLTDEIINSICKWEPTAENIRAGTVSKWHWEVYGLGLRSRRPGAIYQNWSIVDKWPDRMACTHWGFAMDFGFSVDPTALIECAFFQNRLYVRQICYQTDLINLKRPQNPGIPSREGILEAAGIGKMDSGDSPLILADSAHPELITELSIAGFNIQGFDKSPRDGKSYVLGTINKLQQHHICVLRSSNDIITEFRNYIWKRNPRTDEQLTEPIGDFNHALDAIRGWVADTLIPQRYRRNEFRHNQSSARKRSPYARLN